MSSSAARFFGIAAAAAAFSAASITCARSVSFACRASHDGASGAMSTPWPAAHVAYPGGNSRRREGKAGGRARAGGARRHCERHGSEEEAGCDAPYPLSAGPAETLSRAAADDARRLVVVRKGGAPDGCELGSSDDVSHKRAALRKTRHHLVRRRLGGGGVGV